MKPEHGWYVTVDGNVRIGATVHGLGVEIEDPDGWVRVLIGALDGTRSSDEIRDMVLADYPEMPVADVMQQLSDAGFLEDAAGPVPEELSERERERYSRGVAFFRWIDRTARASSWDVQIRLRRSRVLLIGVGGVGGAVAQGLVASGVGRLHCVDADTVELSNLNRQILFRENEIGESKVDAAVVRLRELNSDVRVTSEERWIAGQADVAELLEPGYDLLALCADRPQTIRRWANRACGAVGLPWVVGGYHGPIVSGSLHGPGQGACWECVHDHDAEQAEMRLPAGMTLESLAPRLPWNPVNVVSANLTGTLLTHFALAALTGAPPLKPGFRYEVNLVRMDSSMSEHITPQLDCPVCGTAP